MEDKLENIDKLKQQVNSIDNNIVGNLIERKKIATAILDIKKELGITYKDQSRENEIVNRLLEMYNSVDSELVKKIYKQIFNDSIKEYNVEFNRNKINTVHEALKLRPLIIAGPCAVESREQIERISRELSEQGIKLLRGGAFKPRTSPDTFQGLGDVGIEFIREAADSNNMFIVTEVLEAEQLEKHYDKIDVIQIGSRNMSSFGFLKEVGRKTAKDKKPVLLKRGFNATLKEFLFAAQYILEAGNPNVILCLRGIRTFEQIDSKLRFTPDLASILELKDMTKLPVIFDPSHSTGNSAFVPKISVAALCLGADGLLIETHYEPHKALSDGEQAILPTDLFGILNI